jgi:hypothetical protein
MQPVKGQNKGEDLADDDVTEGGYNELLFFILNVAKKTRIMNRTYA